MDPVTQRARPSHFLRMLQPVYAPGQGLLGSDGSYQPQGHRADPQPSSAPVVDVAWLWTVCLRAADSHPDASTSNKSLPGPPNHILKQPSPLSLGTEASYERLISRLERHSSGARYIDMRSKTADDVSPMATTATWRALTHSQSHSGPNSMIDGCRPSANVTLTASPLGTLP
jgi:hypothetical protein